MTQTSTTESLTSSEHSPPAVSQRGGASPGRSAADGDPFVLCVEIESLDGYERLYGDGLRDHVLEHVHARITSQLRDDDVVQPWLGYGFTATLTGGSSLHDARAVAERLAQTIRDPFVIEGQSLLVSAHVAVTQLHPDGLRVEVSEDDAAQLT